MRMPRLLCFLLLLIGLGEPSTALFAQTRGPAQEDLKVGLVLSGGGAKGYAHIGALKAIEEAGIRVDYLGGTSMGAIVGGLYAAGYSADQLEQLLRSIDILAVIRETVPREDRPIYERLYEERYLLSLSLKDFSPQLPAALSDGQRIYDLFQHWTATVGHIHDFSQLPIPFLAVASDVVTGDAVVLENGVLAAAMRASAALPAVLSPYKIDGRLLTDGGVVNNYPAEEVKQKGMDYIIGVSVESDNPSAEEINSIDKLLTQIAFFQATQRNVTQYAITDLDIEPALDAFSVLSFEAVDTLIQRGYVAAKDRIEELRAIAARQAGPSSRRDSSAAPIPDRLNIRELKLEGNRDLSRRQILSPFDDRLPGQMSWEEFREGLADLHFSGRYASINYRWQEPIETEGGVDMDMAFTPQPSFGQRLRLGLHFDEIYRSNFLLNLTLYDLIADNTITSIDLIGGNRLRYRFDFRVNRVNGSAFGLRSTYSFVEIDLDPAMPIRADPGLVFDNLDFRFTDFSTELYWDVLQTTNSLSGVAAELKHYTTGSDQLSGTESPSVFNLGQDFYFVPKGYIHFDKLDAPYYPLRGFAAEAAVRAIRRLSEEESATEWYYNGDVEVRAMLPVVKDLSIGLELTAGGFLDDRSASPYRYYLGSNNLNLINNFKPFLSLEVGQAVGNSLFMTAAFLRWRIFPSHFLHLGGRIARLANPESLPSSIDRGLLAAGSFRYGFASPLGPVELTYARGNEGGSFYVNLGPWF